MRLVFVRQMSSSRRVFPLSKYLIHLEDRMIENLLRQESLKAELLMDQRSLKKNLLMDQKSLKNVFDRAKLETDSTIRELKETIR